MSPLLRDSTSMPDAVCIHHIKGGWPSPSFIITLPAGAPFSPQSLSPVQLIQQLSSLSPVPRSLQSRRSTAVHPRNVGLCHPCRSGAGRCRA